MTDVSELQISDIVRISVLVAQQNEARGNTFVALLLRRMARAIAAPDVEAGSCACGCGERLVHPRRGRRRRWVDESHRRRARRK